jgi:hypothetical protein
MTEIDENKRIWVARVLGVTLPSAAPPATAEAGDILTRWRAARTGWQDATDLVNEQLNALAKALRAASDKDLAAIADSGLMTVTGGFRTRMMAALKDLGADDAAKLRKDGGKAAGFAEKLKAQIEGDAKVAACDANPFGVAVAVRATLGTALANLAAVLRDAARA